MTGNLINLRHVGTVASRYRPGTLGLVSIATTHAGRLTIENQKKGDTMKKPSTNKQYSFEPIAKGWELLTPWQQTKIFWCFVFFLRWHQLEQRSAALRSRLLRIYTKW